MNRKKNVIIAVMMVAILLMATGYAYFASRLNISATGNITGNWNVYFSKITEGTIVGNASNKTTPSISGTTANIDVNLKLPGDSITYELTLTNAGTINAVVEEVNVVAEGTSAIIYTISGIEKGDKLTGGNSIVFSIKAEYDSNVTSQPNDTSKSITISINCVQDMGQNITDSDSDSNDVYGSFTRKILNSNNARSDDNIDFSTITNDANDKGLFISEDDDGTSYYFRGDVENNYVQFGYWETDNVIYGSDGPSPEFYDTLSACEAGTNHTMYGQECIKFGFEAGEPMYWRIIRINGDGTIRMIYDGIEPLDNDTNKNVSLESASFEAYNHFNWTYSGEASINTWYQNNLKEKYEKYIADSIFCIDNYESSYYYMDWDGNQTTQENAQITSIYYGAHTRLDSSDVNPSLTCKRPEDRYTSDVSNGNGKLTHPVGMITADEAVMAMGKTNTSTLSSYLNRGFEFRTSTPKNYDAYEGFTYFFSINNTGSISTYNNTNSPLPYQRPVINIKGDVSVTGSGIIGDPYIVEMN